jgi:predicted Zn finger-like uncharacterized protein
MRIPCPSCGKTLAVAEDLLGRRVKCPSCQGVFQVPLSLAVPTVPAPMPAHTEVSERRLPAPRSAPPPLPMKKVPARPKPRPDFCPDCRAPLAAGANECPECDWIADEREIKASRAAPRQAARDEEVDGCCYIQIRKDKVDLTQEIEKRMEGLIETEQLDMRIMDEGEEAPDELGRHDMVISGKVTECDYGSQLMRYFLTIVALFGPGSCRLKVVGEVETANGETLPIKAKSRIAGGLFGGTGPSLMKHNVKAVAKRIANGAARHASGRTLLNVQAYHCAYWSLGLGLASLIPCFGVLLAMIGSVVGGIALVTIRRRGLPRGLGVASAGLILCFLGFAVTAGMIAKGMFK